MDGCVPVLGDALLGVAWRVGVVACLLAGGMRACAGQGIDAKNRGSDAADGKQTSGAKAPPHSAFSMPGLKPRPTLQEQDARVRGFEVEPARVWANRRFLARRGMVARPGSAVGGGSIPHLKNEMWGTPISAQRQKQILRYAQDDNSFCLTATVIVL
jgi:hypothetical protein